MPSSTPGVEASLIIRRCPRQKRLGMLIYVSTREDTFPKPLVFSLTETFHAYVVGHRQKDDQRKAWNRHISPPAERP
jgi:hypothetical protein